MSRLAKRPINLPSGVEVKVEGNTIYVKGPKGTLSQDLVPGIEFEHEKGEIFVKGEAESKFIGLYWALLTNMVKGVSVGFEKHLELIGVGYRAALQGDVVEMQLGYSNPIKMPLPQGVGVAIEKNTAITISGIDKQKVGQFAADLRALRKPEPYKGKGVRYRNEYVRKKAGKAKSK